MIFLLSRELLEYRILPAIAEYPNLFILGVELLRSHSVNIAEASPNYEPVTGNHIRRAGNHCQRIVLPLHRLKHPELRGLHIKEPVHQICVDVPICLYNDRIPLFQQVEIPEGLRTVGGDCAVALLTNVGGADNMSSSVTHLTLSSL